MHIMNKHKYLICVSVLLACPFAIAVKITKIGVPDVNSLSPIDKGIFNCQYDLEGDSLYMVKWYKDDREIYRCYNDGSVAVFPTRNLYIRVIDGKGQTEKKSCAFDTSGQTSNQGLPGKYTCEVSGDAPSFSTVLDSVTVPSPMKTTEPPEQFGTSKGSYSHYSTSTNIIVYIDLTILAIINYLYLQ